MAEPVHVQIKHSGRFAHFLVTDEQDHIQRHWMKSVFYEMDMLEDIKRRYLPFMSIIDIGANVGNHTIFFSVILDATVYAMEPDQANFELLQKNVALNSQARVVLHKKAMGCKKSKGNTVHLNDHNCGMVHVHQNKGGDVDITTLDALRIKDFIGVIKIDVEGMEAEVLRGARKLILRDLPLMYVECGTPAALYEVMRLMEEFRYEVVSRFAATPTYLFAPVANEKRLEMYKNHLYKKVSTSC